MTYLSGLTLIPERRGLRDDVYERILGLLLDGNLTPGARLSIEAVANQLQVSPTPVREALVQLESTGLVIRTTLKGYRVAPLLNAEQLVQLFDARLMIEMKAVELAEPVTEEFLIALREAQQAHERSGKQMIMAMEKGKPNSDLFIDYFTGDFNFHGVIFAKAGNRYLIGMRTILQGQLQRARQFIETGLNDVKEATEEHRAIVEAFESRVPGAPLAAMKAHIERVRLQSLREVSEQ